MRFPSSRLRAAILVAAMHLVHAPAEAQQATSRLSPFGAPFWWVSGTLVVVAGFADQSLEEGALEHRTATLDNLEHAGNVLGAGRYILPALGVSYLAGVVTRQRQLSEGTLHSAAAYMAADIVASVMKPAIGRHRPDTTGAPWRFRPFASQGAWHSLPSAHTLHAFTLAGAISEEAHRPWVTVGAYGAATLVAWSRVYADEHWTSDVVISAAVGAAIGHGVVRFLHARQAARALITSRARASRIE